MNKFFKEHIKSYSTFPNNPCNYYCLVDIHKATELQLQDDLQ
jgi:hypothetical protein